MNSVIITMSTEGYLPYTEYFISSVRLKNTHKIYYYLVNVSEGKREELEEKHPDVQFMVLNRELEKFHGLDCISMLKPEMMLEVLRIEGKHLIWIDNSKLVLGSLDFIDEKIPYYDCVAMRSKMNNPDNSYSGFLFAFNVDGVALRDFAELIKDKELLKVTGGGWMCEQEAMYHLKCNRYEFPTVEYLSRKYDTSYHFLHNYPIKKSKNMDVKHHQKNVDALRKYKEIMGDICSR